jgi:hypothetical protein
LTKFVLLQSLEIKRAEEVAYHLLGIFTTLGATNILHSGNGSEFWVIEQLCSTWNDVKIVQGKPRRIQSVSAERTNQNVEYMTATWMESDKTKNGLKV